MHGRNLQMKEILQNEDIHHIFTFNQLIIQYLIFPTSKVSNFRRKCKKKNHLVCWPARGPELNLMFKLFLQRECQVVLQDYFDRCDNGRGDQCST